MEFWGVEVKSGEPLMVEPEDETVVHLSQASLGDVKGRGSEPIYLYASVGGQKLVIGILSFEKFPQVSFDLVFEKKFQLSHSLKSGSVYFTGYKTQLRYGSDDDSIYTDSDAEEGRPVNEIGKPGLPAKQAQPATAKPNELKKSKSDAAKQKVKTVKPNKEDKNKKVKDDGNDSSSEDDEEDDSSEDQEMADASEESSDEDEDGDEDDSDEEDGSDEEEPPKMAIASKKREAEPAAKTPASDKKAKLVTPQKNDGEKPYVHVATPYPKQAAKKAANKDQPKQQTPNTSEYACKACNRSFKSDQALQSHNKAKHTSSS